MCQAESTIFHSFSVMQGIENHYKSSSHPNVLRLLYAYEDDECLYSLTESTEDMAISSQEPGGLLEATVAAWGHQLLQALVHCHEQGELRHTWYMQLCVLATVHVVYQQQAALKCCLLQALFMVACIQTMYS